MSKPFAGAGPSGLHCLVLVMLSVFGSSACSVEDSVSPRTGPDVMSPGSTVDAVNERIDGVFAGGPKRGKDRPGGRLAFSTLSGGVYTMEPGGFGVVRLTDGSDPSWSPDGKRIAFSRTTARPPSLLWISDVYVMNADGSNVTLVASEGYHPTWSPDGTRLAYGCGGICTINVDGTGRRVLTPLPSQPAGSDQCIIDSDPTWSPNGTTIAFTRWPDTRLPPGKCLPLSLSQSFPFDFWTQVWFVESDGSGERPLRGPDGLPLTYAGWPAGSGARSQLAQFTLYGGFEAFMVANSD